MFSKLRNKLVLINFSVTTIVVVVVFSIIYISATQSADRRPPMPKDAPEFNTEIQDFMNGIIKEEKEAAARQLLFALTGAGIAIEIAVVLISYFLAEQAIKPIRKAYDTQKVFIANASHEIKTPLAAIAANLEAADIKGNKWIKNIEKETIKLTALNNELLTLARNDLNTARESKMINLKEFTIENIRTFEPRMKDIVFKLNAANIQTKIDADALSQIMSILMDNAIKYSDKIIRLQIDEHSMTLANDGAKISKTDLPNIFDRFYQTDKTSEGVGLGLSIAESIADNHGWTLVADSNSKETVFTLKFS